MSEFFKKCEIKYASFAEALLAGGASCRLADRKKIAKENGFKYYDGEPAVDAHMLEMLKAGKLKKPPELNETGA